MQVFVATCLVTGCSAAEQDPSDTEFTSNPSASSDTSGGESGSESDSGETSTSGEPGTETGEGSSTTHEPIDCGPYTQCGVLCVDLQSDPENCGVCGVSCIVPNAIPTCVEGMCALGDCHSGWSDCDADINTGCETELPDGESCPLLCDPQTPEVCNLFDDNCNESCDEGVDGCRHGVHRASSPTLGHLYTTDLAEASSGDFHLEAENYFFLYAQPQAGIVALHRCLLGNGKRFYTTSSSCEGAGTNEGPLGYLAGEQICGSAPLYRLYHPQNGHFYTTSAGERDNAVNNLGYTFESTIGFVWSGL